MPDTVRGMVWASTPSCVATSDANSDSGVSSMSASASTWPWKKKSLLGPS